MSRIETLWQGGASEKVSSLHRNPRPSCLIYITTVTFWKHRTRSTIAERKVEAFIMQKRKRKIWCLLQNIDGSRQDEGRDNQGWNVTKNSFVTHSNQPYKTFVAISVFFCLMYSFFYAIYFVPHLSSLLMMFKIPIKLLVISVCIIIFLKHDQFTFKNARTLRFTVHGRRPPPLKNKYLNP